MLDPAMPVGRHVGRVTVATLQAVGFLNAGQWSR